MIIRHHDINQLSPQFLQVPKKVAILLFVLVCEHHMLLSALQILCTTSKSVILYFENIPATSVILCHRQMSVVTGLLSISTSPLLEVLLFLFCPFALWCSLVRARLHSFWSEVEAEGCPKPMVARLVSMIEELVWELKWLLAIGLSAQLVLPQANVR